MRRTAVVLCLLAASCSGKKSSEAGSGDSPAGETTAPASDCDLSGVRALQNAAAQALRGYDALTFPKADADCETLRVFTERLAPLAQEVHGKMTAVGQWLEAASPACQKAFQEEVAPAMRAAMADLQTRLEEPMSALDRRSKDCMDHPGFAEAFDKASFPARR